jgi:hypothetical protein
MSPESAQPAFHRRIAAKLQQAGLLRMKHKRELLKPQAHRFPEAPRVGFVFETRNNIICEPQNDDVTFGFSTSPPLSPEIKDVVQVHVGKQR